ncbi:MAG: hypothetical protein QOK44_2420 [Betaproteobacteria bacterium]|jgi:hypothetical protein|nr:hypothetical protein [Betaproteobacteria bacterium]
MAKTVEGPPDVRVAVLLPPQFFEIATKRQAERRCARCLRRNRPCAKNDGMRATAVGLSLMEQGCPGVSALAPVRVAHYEQIRYYSALIAA